jgi:hypothetical protein
MQKMGVYIDFGSSMPWIQILAMYNVILSFAGVSPIRASPASSYIRRNMMRPPMTWYAHVLPAQKVETRLILVYSHPKVQLLPTPADQTSSLGQIDASAFSMAVGGDVGHSHLGYAGGFASRGSYVPKAIGSVGDVGSGDGQWWMRLLLPCQGVASD